MPDATKISRFTKWLKSWNEGPITLLLIVALFYSVQVINTLDPGSGSFGLGHLMVPILAAVYFFSTGFVAWNGVRLNFPALFREFNECLEDDLSTNKETRRTWRILAFFLLIYFGYFAAMGAFVLLVLFSGPR